MLFRSFFSFSLFLSLSFSPFSLLLSLLLSPSLYKWNAAVTYRWRNPQSWFHEEKSCSLSLSLSPFSFPSSFHCPFPFLLSPSPFPFPFPFSLPHFPFSAFSFRFLIPFPFPFSFPFPLSPFLFSFSPFSFLLQLDGTVPGGCAIYLVVKKSFPEKLLLNTHPPYFFNALMTEMSGPGRRNLNYKWGRWRNLAHFAHVGLRHLRAHLLFRVHIGLSFFTTK